mgnify:CR=1 FL=1|tara:strand:- start:198 stop:503 length:306 start_codon:yes stop_codon:yes gene_type:complete
MKIDKTKHGNMTLTADDSGFLIGQDVSEILKQAEQERKISSEFTNTKKTYRKFGTIPDIICIEIKNKYNIDIHAQEASDDPSIMKRFKQIIVQEYPYLLSN